jgi:hypothetical protein
LRTYPLKDNSGATYAFEVANVLLSPREIARFVKAKLGAEITAGPKGYLASDDMRLRFRYAGAEFEVFEPFGDNSRYWIGPAGERPTRVVSIDALHAAFIAYRPSLVRRFASVLRI